MTASELIVLMRGGVKKAKEQGAENIAIDKMAAWFDSLDNLIKEAEEGQEVDHKAKMERYYNVDIPEWLEDVKANKAIHLEVVKAVGRFGEIALKSSLLINGGAAVAFLAFIGTIWNSSGGESSEIINLSRPLMLFVSGVLSGALACGTAYLAQSLYAKFNNNKWGDIVKYITVALVFGAYGLFGAGAYKANEVFKKPVVVINKTLPSVNIPLNPATPIK